MYKSLGIFIFCVCILGSYLLSYAAKESETSSSANSVTTTSYNIADVGNKIKDVSIRLYNTLVSWYHTNNTRVTILPDLLRVPMIDCIAVLLGIFLGFFAIIRYLSK